MRTSGYRSLTAFVQSTPSSSGMRISMRIISTGVFARAASASRPFDAVAATSISSFISSTIFRLSRISS